MTFFNVSIGILAAVIGVVIYSALVVSGRQERIAQRVREENKFERAPSDFAFEASEELTDLDEVDESSEIDEVFKFKKTDS